MASINVNIRMDSDLKNQYESLCEDMGMSMTTAFNIFAKKAVREYPSVAFAEIGYRDRRTLFLVNSAPEAAVKVRVSGLPEGKVGVADLISGRNAVTVDHGGFEVELQPYEVKCLRFVAE